MNLRERIRAALDRKGCCNIHDVQILGDAARALLPLVIAELERTEVLMAQAEHNAKHAHREWDADKCESAKFANTLRAIWEPLETYRKERERAKADCPGDCLHQGPDQDCPIHGARR